jgi:hypothetical protein
VFLLVLIAFHVYANARASRACCEFCKLTFERNPSLGTLLSCLDLYLNGDMYFD